MKTDNENSENPMSSYFISVAAAALLCALCEALVPKEGGLGKTLSLACAALLILTMMSPLKNIASYAVSVPDIADTETDAGDSGEEYRAAVASQTARTAAAFAESKFSVSSDSVRITVSIPDGSSVPDKITLYLTGGKLVSSAALEEYLTDKMGVECAVIKE
jgi:hypothetical protein